MLSQAHRFLVVFALLLFLGGCGPTREQATAGLLNQRLQEQLGADVTANRVALETLPTGARVTFLDTSPTPGGLQVSDPGVGSVRASVIEALLDPSLMRIGVTDTSALSPDQKAARISNLTQYIQSMQLGSTLQPGEPPGAQQPGPAGMTLTINVQCPYRNDGSGYDSGVRKPACF